jgi:hypothetical protein
MEIPVCPGCDGSHWESIEEYDGGSRQYALRAEGWTLVEDWLELNQTNYRCRDCGYDPDDEDDELWAALNEIDTAPAADTAPARSALGEQAMLWEQGPSAA